MRLSVKIVILAGALIVFAVVALKGAAILIPTGTWVPQANLSSSRANASAALLQDGRLLITGGDSGSGPVATADFFAADGTISAAPPMVNARSKHVAVTLHDGRVLVAGGITAGGSATSTAEIYDPVTNSWTSIGTGMTEARSSASAALLPDGRVIIAGGQNGGSISSTIEIFDPVAGSFSFAGTMSSPRTQHAMAVLHDGRVIITGGSNGTSPVGSTDILDPATGTIAAGPNLAVARFGHSATTLLNGQVVIIGGNNGNADSSQMDLASAELFDPAAGTFTTLAANMATPREGHLALLLPNNGSVLIAGGTSAGTAIASAELFTPGESPEGFWTYGFAPTGLMSAARTAAAASANQITAPTSVMQRNGVVVVVGGDDANGNALNSTEGYGYATIQTDQSDYAPGTTVTITGSGWKPGETVNFQLVESPLIDTHGPFSAVADAAGNIVNTQFSPDEHDISITFTLIATGQTSGFQAQTIFTDANPQTLTITTGQHPNPVVAGASATYTLTETFNGNGTSCTVDLSAAPTVPPAWPSPPVGGFFSFSSGSLTSIGADQTSTLTISTPSAMTGNTYNFTVTATPRAPTCQNNPKTLTVAGTLVVSAPANVATTLMLNSVGPNSVPFGSTGSVTFTAALTRNDTSAGVVGATINFTVDGVAAGSVTTAAAGVAAFTTYNPSALSIGPHNVAASFTAATISGTNFSGSSSGTLPLTVNKATPVITWNNPADITYGTALDATQLNASASVQGSFTYTPASGTVLSAGSSQTLHVDFTPSDTTDYSTASKDVTINVNKRNATWTTNPASKTYGDLDPNPLTTGSGSNFVTADGVTASYTRATGETVAGNPYHITATLSATVAGALDNYNVTNNGADFTINKRNATWTTNPASKTYGDLDPSPLTTGSGSNFVTADGVTASYTRATGEMVAGNPYHITATLSATVAGALDNYNVTNNGADFTINKRNATWTTNPASKTYGDLDPSPLTTGSGSNFVTADGVTASYTRATGEMVAGNPYHITATLSATVAGALDNYNVTNNGADFTINKRNATWTTNPASKTYGDLDPSPLTTGSGSNFVTADGVTASYTRATGETVAGNPYHITAALSATVASALDNYNVTNNGADFTINKRNATWTTNPASKTYGDLDPSPLTTGSGSNFVTADGVTASYTRATGEMVAGNPYHITATLSATVASALDNYNVTNNGADFTINKRNATWTTNPASKTYGDLDPSPLTTGSGSNFVTADGVTASYTRATGETVAGNPYHITATLSATVAGALDNYNVTNNGADFTINKRNATWTTNPASKTYGDLDPSPLTTGSGSNFVTADGVTASYTRATGEMVAGNPYHITATLSATVASALDNYNVTNAGASFTINVKTVTPSVTASDKLYDGTKTATITACTVSPKVGADDVACVAGSATFASANASPTAQTVTAIGILLTGVTAPNYVLSSNTAMTMAHINPAPTSTLVSSSANSSVFGQPITFSATVSNTATSPTPTGSVQFIIDGTNFGSPVSVAGSGGTATATSMSTSTLSPGVHNVVASYTNSDGNFVGSTSSTFRQQVNYGFLGLQSPYMPPPTTFNVKRTMPLKWQYTNSGGAVVNSASANPVVMIQGPYACGGANAAGDITVNDAGASGYQYDSTTNTWQFNWQIKGNAPGCYDIFIKSQQSGQMNGAFPINVVNQ